MANYHLKVHKGLYKYVDKIQETKKNHSNKI